MLAKLPKLEIEELLNGKYVEKLDNYINDQFVFRRYLAKDKVDGKKWQLTVKQRHGRA